MHGASISAGCSGCSVSTICCRYGACCKQWNLKCRCSRGHVMHEVDPGGPIRTALGVITQPGSNGGMHWQRKVELIVSCRHSASRQNHSTLNTLPKLNIGRQTKQQCE